MQHDTSPHRIPVGGRHDRRHHRHALLSLSRSSIYIHFYRSFNRFRMKCFFHEALTYLRIRGPRLHHRQHAPGGALRDRKARRDDPEMAAFARRYGFRFIAHELRP